MSSDSPVSLTKTMSGSVVRCSTTLPVFASCQSGQFLPRYRTFVPGGNRTGPGHQFANSHWKALTPSGGRSPVTMGFTKTLNAEVCRSCAPSLSACGASLFLVISSILRQRIDHTLYRQFLLFRSPTDQRLPAGTTQSACTSV